MRTPAGLACCCTLRLQGDESVMGIVRSRGHQRTYELLQDTELEMRSRKHHNQACQQSREPPVSPVLAIADLLQGNYRGVCMMRAAQWGSDRCQVQAAAGCLAKHTKCRFQSMAHTPRHCRRLHRRTCWRSPGRLS